MKKETIEALAASEPWEDLERQWEKRDTERLLACAYKGDALGLKKALERGDPSARDAFGRPALCLATLSGSIECVRILLPLSDPNATDEAGNTALMRACGRTLATPECVRALAQVSDLSLENESGRTALMLAAGSGPSRKNLEVLLEISPEREGEIGRAGESALTRAVSAERWDCAELLIRAGADPWRARDDGHSAMSLAAIDGPEGVARLAAEIARMESAQLARELGSGLGRGARAKAAKGL